MVGYPRRPFGGVSVLSTRFRDVGGLLEPGVPRGLEKAKEAAPLYGSEAMALNGTFPDLQDLHAL